MRSSSNRRAHARHAALASALLLLFAAPARAEESLHSKTTPARADTRAGLLLLSFLVPLPLPLALVAPPAASRPPVPTSEREARRAPAPAAPAARVAKRAGE